MSEAFDKALENLRAACAEVPKERGARKEAANQVRSLFRQMQDPRDFVFEMLFQSFPPTALKTLSDMGVIDAINQSPKPLTATELGHMCVAEPNLIMRLIRPLLPMRVFAEKGEQCYGPTPISRLLSEPSLKGGLTFMLGPHAKVVASLPDFLEENGYHDPQTSPSPFQLGLDTNLSIFAWLMERPTLMGHFNAFMRSTRIGLPDWFEGCPVDDMILEGADPTKPLLVDLGGGEGHDILAFRRAFPHAKGDLVLQDLPSVIHSIDDLDESIIRQVHDFFTPQPVRGARVYYFRQCFHNYGDEKALQMLHHVRSAMTRGYSKLLINDYCLGDKGVAMQPAIMDLNMLALLSARERTRKQWNVLLSRAGFRIMHVYPNLRGEGESLIEAEMA